MLPPGTAPAGVRPWRPAETPAAAARSADTQPSHLRRRPDGWGGRGWRPTRLRSARRTRQLDPDPAGSRAFVLLARATLLAIHGQAGHRFDTRRCLARPLWSVCRTCALTLATFGPGEGRTVPRSIDHGPDDPEVRQLSHYQRRISGATVVHCGISAGRSGQSRAVDPGEPVDRGTAPPTRGPQTSTIDQTRAG